MSDVTRGLLDTSVLIDHASIEAGSLPDEAAIAAVSLAELAAGPHATDDPDERARRQDRLQWASSTWDSLPFDADAATAVANGLPLYTRNPADFAGLDHLLRIIDL